jgi:hypothetical protein
MEAGAGGIRRLTYEATTPAAHAGGLQCACIFAQYTQLRRKSALSRGAVFHAIICATPRRRDINSLAESALIDLRWPIVRGGKWPQ